MTLGTNQQQGMLLNIGIGIGIVGAPVAGWVISPLLGIGTINQGNFSLGAFLAT